MSKKLVVLGHGDNPQTFVGIQVQEMCVVRDKVICTSIQSSTKNWAVGGIVRHHVARQAFGYVVAASRTTLSRQLGKTCGKSEIVHEHALDFVQQVITDEDAPGCFDSSRQQRFGSLAQ